MLPSGRFPLLLHYFWMGPNLPRTQCENILLNALFLQPLGWTVCLWGDGTERNLTDLQKSPNFNETLVSLRDFRKLKDFTALEGIVRLFSNPPTLNFPAIKDVFSGMILKEMGGVFSDVDLEIQTETFLKTHVEGWSPFGFRISKDWVCPSLMIGEAGSLFWIMYVEIARTLCLDVILHDSLLGQQIRKWFQSVPSSVLRNLTERSTGRILFWTCCYMDTLWNGKMWRMTLPISSCTKHIGTSSFYGEDEPPLTVFEVYWIRFYNDWFFSSYKKNKSERMYILAHLVKLSEWPVSKDLLEQCLQGNVEQKEIPVLTVSSKQEEKEKEEKEKEKEKEQKGISLLLEIQQEKATKKVKRARKVNAFETRKRKLTRLVPSLENPKNKIQVFD